MADLQTPVIDSKRVASLMAAFRYGGRVADLGKVDDRHSSGQYDHVQWHVALDGATLFGFDTEFEANLLDALGRGLSERDAEAYAYETTALANGFTV